MAEEITVFAGSNNYEGTNQYPTSVKDIALSSYSLNATQISSYGQSDSGGTIYTVPQGKTFFMTALAVSYLHNGGTGYPARTTVTRNGGTFYILVSAQQIAATPLPYGNQTITFGVPLILRSGETMAISVNFGNMLAGGSVFGYLVNNDEIRYS